LGGLQISDSNKVRCALADSPWEVGYSLIAILEARDSLIEEKVYQSEFDERIHNSILYLLSKSRIGKDSCNWDNILWDTAVVTRALVLYFANYQESANTREMAGIIGKAIKWMNDALKNWEYERYLCTGDIAQVLRTFMCIETLPETAKRQVTELSPIAEADIIKITRRILSEKEEVQLVIPKGTNEGETTFKWTDQFASSTVILSLVEVYSGYSPLPNEDRRNIADVLSKSVRGMELEQQDGKWGLEGVTALTLSAYLRAFSVLADKIQPEHHLIFKCLRRLCDSSQRYDDGSIMHSTEYTIFFSCALNDLLKYWRLPNSLMESNVLDIYDFMIWIMPTSSSTERALSLNLQNLVNAQRESVSRLQKSLSIASRKSLTWKRYFFISLWIAAIVLVWFISGAIELVSQESIQVNAIQVSSWPIIIASTSLWLTVGTILYRTLLSQKETLNSSLSAILTEEELKQKNQIG
jgi:hypothetical protein